MENSTSIQHRRAIKNLNCHLVHDYAKVTNYALITKE